MNRAHHIVSGYAVGRPHWWQLAAIAIATLVLCSCRAPALQQMSDVRARPSAGHPIADCPVACPHHSHQTVYPALPPRAWTGAPGDGYTIPGLPAEEQMEPTVAANVTDHGASPWHPGCGTAPWAPPGLRRPWPRDEYLRDGGDRGVSTGIGKDWSVRGLDLEDTIVHFDTLDGRTIVEPSNRVHIYAPRFAAVRKVSSALQHDQQQRTAGLELPIRLSRNDELRIASTVIQPIQPDRQIGSKKTTTLLEEQRGEVVDGSQALAAFSTGFMPHEDLQVIKLGIHDESEKARLALGYQAALAWTNRQPVQVVIDGRRAAIDTGDARPESTYQYVLPPGKHRMRVIKVASRQNARPGETVDFTIRFDNLGDQVIGNVTILDNLTARLEYVEGTAQCDLDADFFTQENEGDSLVLRWEIVDPLDVGKGGIIRFKCRVR